MVNNFKSTLSIEKISKEEIFFYTYAVLHSEKYRRDLSNHLSKELPRIPIPSSSESFESYVRAGRSLATLHVDYENVSLYSCRIEYTDNYERLSQKDLYQLIRMKFINKSERSTVVYNSHIKICDVPLEAYEYVVNGKPALEWVMERQCVKVDKDSGIVNDANDYAIETMDNPAYPLELFQRVVTVSLETMKIVKSLPSLG